MTTIDILGQIEPEVDIFQAHGYIDYPSRIVPIGNVLNGSFSFAMYSILCLDHADHAPITLFIRSAGGDLEEALLFGEFLKSINSPINTIAFDTCYSAGLLLFSFGKIRSCFETTKFLAHSISLIDGSGLNEHNLRTSSSKIRKENQYLCKLLSKGSKRAASWWKKKMDKGKDFYFHTKEAKKIGLINGEIFDACNKFTLPNN